MNFEKNKTSIIVIVALLVVCIGSFFGVSTMTKNDDVLTPPTTLTPTAPTTAPTTSAPVPTTQPVATTAPTTTEPTSGTSSVITTFPITPNTTTTAPSTTAPATTKAPTTTKAPITTEPQAQQPSTTSPDKVIENAALFDKGFLSYMFNPEGNYYYTNSDPWQRALGYHEFFDVAAGFVAIYMDTMRCKFEYGDKDWMIQFWKGQYGLVFVGHEIGVYTKPKNKGNEHYDAASNEEALYMSMTGYRKGEELYTREYGKYWWCTGFVPGKLDNYSDRSELEIRCRITMKDYKMLLGFCGALKENGMVLGENYTTSGLDVFVTW